MNRLATSAVLRFCWIRRRCPSCFRYCLMMGSMTGTRTTRSGYNCYSHGCSGQSGHGMQGRRLQRPLSDGLLLVLCI